MKVFSILFLTIFISFTLYAQDITGKWYGILKLNEGHQLSLVFNIKITNDGYEATMDSPDQDVKDIPVTNISYKAPCLIIEITNANIRFKGSLKENIIDGEFTQFGQKFPLELNRAEIEKTKLLRPQEPKKPLPYYTEEVTFMNNIDGISLSGTLSLPKKEGNYPAVVLISGSGPQNRNEELFGHKPFLIISDYLTRNGIGVLRFDDRGVGQSQGSFSTATTNDFAIDVESAVDYLKNRKEINSEQIGLVGHSEGGIIAPMVANQSDDVSFIVLLAGTGIPGDEILLKQQRLIGEASGMSEELLNKNYTISKNAYEIIKTSINEEQLKTDLTHYLNHAMENNLDIQKVEGMSISDLVNIQLNQLTTPWMQFFIRYNPADALVKVKCPVLALNGGKDLQVPAKVNINAIEKALKMAGNKNFKTKIFPELNHLFQEAETGLPNEYGAIEQTFSPKVLKVMVMWINEVIE